MPAQHGQDPGAKLSTTKDKEELEPSRSKVGPRAGRRNPVGEGRTGSGYQLGQLPFSDFPMCPQAPDPVFTLRGSLEQLVPYTGLTFSAKAGGCQSYCSPLTLCQHWPGLFCCPWDRHSCGSEADLAKQDCYLQSLTSPPPPPPQCPPTKKMDFIQSGNPPDFQPYPQPLSQELGPTAGRTPKKEKKKFCRSLAHPAAAGDAASQSFSGLFLVSASKIPKTGIKLILIA